MANQFLFPRRQRDAVSAIVGTILLVAITVMLAGVLYLIVSGMFSPPPPAPSVVSFEARGWTEGNNTASILVAQGVGDVPVSELHYVIRDSGGTAYLTGPANQPVTTNSVTLQVFYIDHDNDNRITGGDILRIEVQPDTAAPLFDGGIFQMFSVDKQVGSHAL